MKEIFTEILTLKFLVLNIFLTIGLGVVSSMLSAYILKKSPKTISWIKSNDIIFWVLMVGVGFVVCGIICFGTFEIFYERISDVGIRDIFKQIGFLGIIFFGIYWAFAVVIFTITVFSYFREDNGGFLPACVAALFVMLLFSFAGYSFVFKTLPQEYAKIISRHARL